MYLKLFICLCHPDKDMLESYFQSVSDHKDIIRSSMSLQGLILMLKDDVSKVGNVYNINIYYLYILL